MYNSQHLEALQKTVDFVWDNEHCHLFREHWITQGISERPTIKDLEDFTNIPPSNKDILLTHQTPDERLFVPRSDIVCLTSTSGSTRGTPFFIWRNDYGNECYTFLTESGAKRAVMLWTTHSSSAIIASQITRAGLQTIVVDPHQMHEAAKMITLSGCDTLISSPSMVLQLCKYLTDTTVRLHIKHLLLWGEDCSPATKKRINTAYPDAGIYNELSAAEARGLMLYKTPECDGLHSLLHVNTIDTFVDIDSEGLLSFTNINHMYATPMVRYQTGDQGVWHETHCSCGSLNPRIQLTGRKDVDFVRVHNLELRIELIDEVLSPFQEHLTPIIRATVEEKLIDSDLKIELIIGVQKNTSSKMLDTILAHEIETALRTMPVSANLTVEKAIGLGILTNPKVSFLTDVPTSNKNKTIKLITQ